MYLYKRILIIAIIISALGLYYIRGLGLVVRLMDILSVSLIIVNLLLYVLYSGRAETVKKQFSISLVILLAGILLSSFSALYNNNQPLGVTLYQQRHMYAFLFYFLLFYLAPKPKYIVDLLYYFGIVGGIFFVIQYVVYPTLITDAKIFIDRGTIRMNLPGTFFMHIGFFLSVERFFSTFKLKYGFGVILLFLVAVLSGFRSTLALYILISTGYALISNQVKSRFLIFSLYSVIIVSGFFAFHSIIMEMKESAMKESTEGTSNIRYRAAEYFMAMNENVKSKYLFGNGEPTERSSYGRRLALISIGYGYYLSDIGIVGFYFKYGLLPSLVVLFIILKILFTRIYGSYMFIKMFFLFQLFLLFNSITSFEVLSGIIAISMMLYLLDVDEPMVISN